MESLTAEKGMISLAAILFFEINFILKTQTIVPITSW